MTSEKNSPCRSGSRTPSVLVLRVVSERAAPFGAYRSDSATSRTRRTVSGFTGPLALRTRETVATEKPAARATSLIVTAMRTPSIGSRARTKGGVVRQLLETVTSGDANVKKRRCRCHAVLATPEACAGRSHRALLAYPAEALRP